tara:strand:- start:415 stop:1194 length:780 start_codon:yes stop_codon:yes gene_type:complete
MVPSIYRKHIFSFLLALILLQALLLKVFYFNLSSSLHWHIIENYYIVYDNLHEKKRAFYLNKKILNDYDRIKTENQTLKSEKLISDRNVLFNKQFENLYKLLSNIDDWSFAKTRQCDSNEIYAELSEPKKLLKGSLAINDEGVVGLLAQDCDAKFCTVNLLKHLGTSIALNNKTNKISGLLSVNGDLITLDYVNQKINLMNNETLYTSGFLKQQPAGFPVAVVGDKYTDLKNKTSYYLSTVAQSNCPSMLLIWSGRSNA